MKAEKNLKIEKRDPIKIEIELYKGIKDRDLIKKLNSFLLSNIYMPIGLDFLRDLENHNNFIIIARDEKNKGVIVGVECTRPERDVLYIKGIATDKKYRASLASLKMFEKIIKIGEEGKFKEIGGNVQSSTLRDSLIKKLKFKRGFNGDALPYLYFDLKNKK